MPLNKCCKLNSPTDDKTNHDNLTAAETLILTLSAVRFAFGQWPDTDDKHTMAEAATEFATDLVAMVSELKKSQQTTDCAALAKLLDDVEPNYD